MGLGTTIRHRMGRFELPAANAYRAVFINLADLARTLATISQPRRILEIGCGDGTFANELLAAIPTRPTQASTSLLRRAVSSRVTPAVWSFGRCPRLTYCENQPFNLSTSFVIVDVLHHVPPEERAGLLADAARLTAPEGILAVKEWERGRNVAHVLTYSADRYVSGIVRWRFRIRTSSERF